MPQQDTFWIFGIWNIPNKTGTRKILKSMEYGIFAEYSEKIEKQSKYAKFWNMEYSMEYSIFQIFLIFRLIYYFSGIFREYSIFHRFQYFSCSRFFGIFHIPKIEKVACWGIIFEYSIFHKMTKIKLLKERTEILKWQFWLW